MGEVLIVVRTADQTRKAEVSLADSSSGGDVIQAAVDNWALPKDTDYSLVNVTSGKTLTPTDTLQALGVKQGDILEVQPVLVAGGRRPS